MRDLDHIAELVESMTEARGLEHAATVLAEWAVRLTGCEGAFVRMRHEGAGERSWLPVIARAGVERPFLRDEGLLSDRDCLCGLVASGATARLRPDLLTADGSFLWSDEDSTETTALADSVPSFRGRCMIHGYGSLAIVPLADSSGIVGSLHVADERPGLFEQFLPVIEAAGRMAGRILVRFELQDLEHAALAAIREAVLPTTPPFLPGIDLGICATQADAPYGLGGDFYDAYELPEGRVALIAGDCSGKGIDAVGTAARIRHALATLAALAIEPSRFLQAADSLVAPLVARNGWFASVSCCTIDPSTETVQVGLAGHPAPLRFRGTTVDELAAPANLPLGTGLATPYADARFELRPDDLLLVYTDGVTECRRNGSLFGIEGVTRAMRAADAPGVSLSEVACSIIGSCAAHHDPALPEDDRLVLLARAAG